MDVPRHPPTPGAGCHLPMLLPRFTAAPHALAVAGDATRRSTMELVLRRQGFAVTHCSDPVVAMAVLRDRGGGFARVVVDMFPPRGGALELLEFAIGEMRLHADVMSRAGDIYGPLVMKELDIFRQPITSKASNESRSPEARPDSQSNGSVTATASMTPLPGRRAATRRTRRSRQPSETASQEVEQEREHSQPAVQQQEQPAQRPPKKARLIWTPELHDKFVDAYNKLLPSGYAVPKKILELMNEKTLTRENVASHLQKYRLNLKQEEQQFLPMASPTKHQRAPPSEASLLSPNMSQQHDIFMAQRTAAVYMNYGFIAQKVIRTPTVSGIQNNCQELHMQAFEAVNMNKENIVTTVHARDGSTGKVVGPKEMYSGAQVEHEFDIDPLNDLDGTFQEDLSTIIQQNLNKDPGPLWDFEFLYNSD